MAVESIRVLLHVHSDSVRTRLLEEIQQHEWVSYLELAGPDLRVHTLAVNDLVFIETGTDVATLVQIVDDLFRSNPTLQSVPVIAIVSEEIALANPGLTCWLHDGGAAIFAVWFTDGDHFSYMSRALRRFKEHCDGS